MRLLLDLRWHSGLWCLSQVIPHPPFGVEGLWPNAGRSRNRGGGLRSQPGDPYFALPSASGRDDLKGTGALGGEILNEGPRRLQVAPGRHPDEAAAAVVHDRESHTWLLQELTSSHRSRFAWPEAALSAAVTPASEHRRCIVKARAEERFSVSIMSGGGPTSRGPWVPPGRVKRRCGWEMSLVPSGESLRAVGPG